MGEYASFTSQSLLSKEIATSSQRYRTAYEAFPFQCYVVVPQYFETVHGILVRTVHKDVQSQFVEEFLEETNKLLMSQMPRLFVAALNLK